MPQKPNNILDDIFRVAWPRPENLDAGSIFWPPSAPYDFQPLPCQDRFVGKDMIEIGVLGVGMFPPGTGPNKGPQACGGQGCPNDAIVTLRFIPKDGPLCQAGAEAPCVCAAGTTGTQLCLDDGSDYGTCDCPPEPDIIADTGGDTSDAGPEPDINNDDAVGAEASGTCDDPVKFTVSADNPVVEVTLPGTVAHQVWPIDFMKIACPMSKPPYSIETYYAMEVLDPGTVTIDVKDYDPPWAFDQYWIDIQSGCGFGEALQCGQSYKALTGEAKAGTFLIGLTHAPPNEVYIPDLEGWTFTLTVTLTPSDG
jgi:hypothetical protein